MIMENTRAHPTVDGWSNPLNSKYYVVIIQFTARQHTEKLKSFVHKLGEGRVREEIFIHFDILDFTILYPPPPHVADLLFVFLTKVGKQYYNFRLAPEEVSDSLSGYTHNAVTPVGMITPLPIIMSHKIAALQPDFFWLVRIWALDCHSIWSKGMLHTIE